MLTKLSLALGAPFRKYNELLERAPLLTKCVTSGVMYGGGDVLAQYAETYAANRELPAEQQRSTVIDKKRVLVFFLFGSTIAGVAYNYWFNYLNELPALLWRMKQTRHRGKILRSYAYLKAHGIEVKLDLAKLPHAAPLTRWKAKAAKILADQLIFSSSYTLVFFMTIGVLQGGIEKWEGERAVERESAQQRERESERERERVRDGEELEQAIQRLSHIVESKAKALLQREQRAERDGETLTDTETDTDTESDVEKEREREQPTEEEQVLLLQRILHKLRASAAVRDAAEEGERERDKGAEQRLTWKEIWTRTWTHCRSVYWSTFLTDCLFWPPLQLINFTFVPVRLQFLYVNVANLAWNTFLSLMANKKDDDAHAVTVAAHTNTNSNSNSNSNEKKTPAAEGKQ